MSRLEEMNEQFRKCSIARNKHTLNDEYVAGHPNAISDGDELGKGEGDSGSVGGLTDIRQRECTIARNKFNVNKQYCAGRC